LSKVYSGKGVGVVIATPGKRLSDSGHVNTLMLLNILKNFHHNIYLFTEEDFCVELDDNIQVLKVRKPYKNSPFLKRVMGHIYYELKMAILIKKFSKEIDIYYFTELLLPIFMTWILRKKNIFILGGSGFKGYLINNPFMGKIFAWIAKFRRYVMYSLVDNIIVYSSRQLKFEGIEKFKNKAVVWHYVYLDLNVFRKSGDLKERGEVIGYVGSISKIKGVMKLIEAIPMILSARSTIRFLFVGDGPDLGCIRSRVMELGCSEYIEFTGWIPNRNIPQQLNRMKLLVCPSETEGIPKTILEAMACGTPVLATPVGGIPDIIKDGETGFIMEDNSPECIAENIIEILEYPELERIVKNARELIEKEYTYKAKIAGYRYLLDKVIKYKNRNRGVDNELYKKINTKKD